MSDEPSASDTPCTNEQRLSFVNCLTAGQRAINESNGVYRAEIKRHQNAGVHTAAGLHIHRLAKKGKVEAVEYLLEEIRFASVIGLLDREQLGMLSEVNPAVAESVMREFQVGEAGNLGWKDGHDGVPKSDNRYPIGSEEAQAWAKMWARGAEAKARELGETGKQASSEKKRLKAEDVTDPVVTNGHANGHANGDAKEAAPAKRGRGRPKGSGKKKALTLSELGRRAA